MSNRRTVRRRPVWFWTLALLVSLSFGPSAAVSLSKEVHLLLSLMVCMTVTRSREVHPRVAVPLVRQVADLYE